MFEGGKVEPLDKVISTVTKESVGNSIRIQNTIIAVNIGQLK